MAPMSKVPSSSRNDKILKNIDEISIKYERSTARWFFMWIPIQKVLITLKKQQVPTISPMIK